MPSFLGSLAERAALVFTHRLTSLASALALAGFALWEIIDQAFLGGSSMLGVEHGVVIHGVVMVLKSTAEFFDRTGDLVKTRREAHHKAQHPEAGRED